MPPTPIVSADKLEAGGNHVLTDHNWAPNNTASLFWAVRPAPKATDSASNNVNINCSYTTVELIHLVGIESLADAFEPTLLRLPIITNTKHIASGDALFLPPIEVKPKSPTPDKPSTWFSSLSTKFQKAGKQSVGSKQKR